MISSEYGWTDETILDLTLGRIRQIAAAITERKLAEDKREKSLIEWQTRLICAFIAHSNPPMDGAENHLANYAAEISIDGKKESDSEEKIDDSNSERPIRYNDMSQLAMFAKGLERGGPVPR